MSSTLAGRFLTTRPPGKSSLGFPISQTSVIGAGTGNDQPLVVRLSIVGMRPCMEALMNIEAV